MSQRPGIRNFPSPCTTVAPRRDRPRGIDDRVDGAVSQHHVADRRLRAGRVDHRCAGDDGDRGLGRRRRDREGCGAACRDDPLLQHASSLPSRSLLPPSYERQHGHAERIELAADRRIRERNKISYRFAHWPIWIWVFFIAPGPLTFDLFEHGFDTRMALWLAVVLVGTGIAGLRGQLPGVEPRPYIIRFTEDRPNPLYRRVCYTVAWSEVIAFARAEHRRAGRRDRHRRRGACGRSTTSRISRSSAPSGCSARSGSCRA